MAIEASRRHKLYERARQGWGAEAADTLMELLPPDGDAVATKADIALLRAELSEVSSELRTEMSELASELRTEMSELSSELRTEMSELASELRTEMSALRAEVHTEMSALSSELTAAMHTNLTQLGGDLYKAMSDQTRTFVLANAAMILTGVGLALTAARFGG